jgi:type I restriction enzyme M protein
LLDTDTKRRIDTARDILVGKVPDPKSQVEQITIALIYKFMDDMDAESEELGGKRKFFADEFGRYGWAKLMRSGLGGHETLNLYAEAIAKMPENPGIPPLFREIFKNAYLPYRDPETLRAFLKIIDEFTYDHSERLGDAFEYLLSVLGSQGDAGQFRTPRHIIDFIVEVVDPKKTETVLDPACGTAGFLISSYKHILKANTDTKGNSTLTPDEKGRLAQNFKGYDISPDMVRLSLVNLYLHGFTDPHIFEYDTLTSQDRWNEYADVILANPPFMSPKGGIRPHNRFSVQSKRSEVLFVDYMAEHLTPRGRAGIIVPEGIIFQSQSAYTQLRKMLAEEYLVVVISLPAGVFNPYSGVKTSILVLDKSLARRADTIAFFRIENDGFGLGAQRREIDKNDLPRAQAEIGEYLRRLRAGESVVDFQPSLGLIVDKSKIAANGDYNLSGERYRENGVRESVYPRVRLGDVLRLEFGARITKRDSEGALFPVYGGGGESFRTDSFTREDDVVISRFAMSPECVRVVQGKFYLLDSGFTFSIADSFVDRASKAYVTQVLQSIQADIYACARGHAQKNIDIDAFKNIQIPLPPLDVQKEIVAEIDGYQKVVNGARVVLDHYHPRIPISPDWPALKFEEAPFQIIDGDRGINYPSKEDFSPSGYCVFLNTKNVRPDGFNFEELEFISMEKDQLLRKGKLQRGDVLLTTRGTVGNTAFYDQTVNFDNIRINSGMLIFRPEPNRLSGEFLFHFFQSENFRAQRDAIISGSAQPQLPIRSLNEARIPLPPLELQQQIVIEIEAEKALVDANRKLIDRFKKKIHSTIDRIWGHEEPAPAKV